MSGGRGALEIRLAPLVFQSSPTDTIYGRRTRQKKIMKKPAISLSLGTVAPGEAEGEFIRDVTYKPIESSSSTFTSFLPWSQISRSISLRLVDMDEQGNQLIASR